MRESFRLYKALSEGIINLADAFFSFEYLDALKGLEVYREAISSGEALSTYYTALQQVDAVKRAMELPQLEPPPADFLESMETYAKEQAPRGAAGEATTSAEGGAAVAPKVSSLSNSFLRESSLAVNPAFANL